MDGLFRATVRLLCTQCKFFPLSQKRRYAPTPTSSPALYPHQLRHTPSQIRIIRQKLSLKNSIRHGLYHFLCFPANVKRKTKILGNSNPHTQGLNMELDLQSLFERHVYCCTHLLRPRTPPPPLQLGFYVAEAHIMHFIWRC